MRFIYSKTFALFAATLIVVVVLLFLQTKGYLEFVKAGLLQAPRPVAAAARKVTDPVRGFFKALYTLRQINQENINLRDRVRALSEQNILLDEYKSQNETLKQEMGFKSNFPGTLEPCTVLAMDPQGLTNTIVLSCGEDSGIKVGEAIMAQGYLVGKLVLVGKETSTAQLITNPEPSIDARVSKTGVEGLVTGSYGSGIKIDRVPQNASLNKGDIIVTAGISSLIPKNLLIGEVGEMLSKPNDLFKRASVVTPVRFNTLQFVYVVKQ